jgi:3-oxoadipate enol-lactonase
MKALTQVFRVIRYDRRGHGKSQVPDGPYSMDRFGKDVLAILDDLNIEKTHWCGLSMGGMVGQWLGANAPERMGKIILANTTCHYPDPTNWHNRIKAVSEGGLAAIADTVIAGWLTADFRESAPQAAENLKAMLLATPVKGYLACCEALSTLDQRELLPKIKSPSETLEDIKGAGQSLTNMAKPAIMVTGRMACAVAPNGAPDCKAGADRLCQSKGYKEGKSLDVDAAEKCSPKIYIPGRKREPGDCRTENYVTKALCQ